MTTLVPARTRTLRLPVRVDLIGGWSDQALFTRPAAVLNAAIGWDGQFPLALSASGVTSLVEGVGTGLGISSILAAGRAACEMRATGMLSDLAVSASVAWEQAEGTHGGWQDAAGAFNPGFHLIEKEPEGLLRVSRNDAHPIFSHLVLFDTGTRRNSGAIGAKVRALLQGPGHFRDSLSEIVRLAQAVFASSDPRWCIDACLAAWRILCGYVPEMNGPEVPMSSACVGYKMVGAGGGGYGLMFVREPDERPAVQAFLEGRGLWARIPELRDGAAWE